MKTRTGMLILAAVFGLVGGAVGGGVFGYVSGSLTANDITSAAAAGTVSTITGGETTTEAITLVEESAAVGVVESATPSVVSITITKELQAQQQFGFGPFSRGQNGTVETEEVEIGGGTGFVVSEDGLILTNRHVVSDQEAGYTVTFEDGTSYEATVVDIDRFTDLALIRVEATDLTPLPLGDSDIVVQGQIVLTIGNTLAEYSNTVTKGIVSGLSRDLGVGYTGLIQTDAAINEGNSGGPLLNLSGEVIGINTAVDRSGEGIGFAIPINDAKTAIESVKENGRIIRAGLGVRYQAIDETFAQVNGLPYDYGAIIRGDQLTLGVVPGSAAAKAGLLEGDIILELDGVKVGIEKDLAEIVKGYEIGEQATLLVYRGGEEIEVELTFEEIPELETPASRTEDSSENRQEQPKRPNGKGNRQK